jgi:hypothetical protein
MSIRQAHVAQRVRAPVSDTVSDTWPAASD